MLGRRSSPAVLLALIATVALVLRLVVTYRVRHAIGLVDGDQTLYRTLARHLGRGEGLTMGHGPSALRPPGYPVFLAAAYGFRDLLGLDVPSRAVVGVAQSVVGAGTVVITGLLGRRLAGWTVGLVAAGLVAIWPSLVLMTAVALSETLFVALLLGALTILFWDEDPTPRVVAVAGAAVGAAFLVRSVAVMALLVAAVWLWTSHRRERRVATWVLPLVVAFAAVVIPWVARNAVHMRTLVITDTNAGLNLCLGNHPGVRFSEPDASYCDLQPGEDEVDADRRRSRQAWAWMRSHPLESVGLVDDRLVELLATDSDAIAEINGDDPQRTIWDAKTTGRITRLADTFWRVARWPAVAGMAVMATRRRLRWPLLAAAATLAPPMVAAMAARYHLPIVPFMAIAIGVLVAEGVGRIRSRTPRSLATRGAPEPRPLP